MSQPSGFSETPAGPGAPRLPRCEECGRLFFYPRLRCPWCLGRRIGYPTAPRNWTVRSFAWVLRPQSRSFDARVPILLMAGTAEGVHLIAEAHGWQPASQPRIGERVVLTSLNLTEGVAVPVYVPAGEE
jgi:uncharacterized OB-fold protein